MPGGGGGGEGGAAAVLVVEDCGTYRKVAQAVRKALVGTVGPGGEKEDEEENRMTARPDAFE